MFVGRVDELDKLEAQILQTREGQPMNFMLTGERGIGKTSLLDYLKHIAQGRLAIEKEKVNFLVIETDIDDRTTQLALVKKIELGLRHELSKSEKARSFLASTWHFLERVEAAGVALKEKQIPDADLIVEEFSYSLAETVSRITDKAGETFSLRNTKG